MVGVMAAVDSLGTIPINSPVVLGARKRCVCATATAVCVATALVAGEVSPAAEPTVTIGDIVERLAAADAVIETLRATCLCLDEFNPHLPRSRQHPELPPPDPWSIARRRVLARWELAPKRRGRVESDIESTYLRDDGTTFESSERHVSTFNGSWGQWLQTERVQDGVEQPAVGRTTRELLGAHTSPYDLSTRYHNMPIAKHLVEHGAKIIGAERWEDRPVVVVETEPVAMQEDYILRQQFWIDVERAASVRRISYVKRGPDRPWGLHYQHDATGHVEAIPGLWLPTVVETTNNFVAAAGPDFLVHKTHIEIVEWVVNEPIDENRFKQEYPDNAIDLSAQ